MRFTVLAFILLPLVSAAQEIPAPMQALSAMLQECGSREENARVGAAMFQADIATLKAANEDLKREITDAPSGPASKNR